MGRLISNVSNIVDIVDNTLKLVESEEYQKVTQGNPNITEYRSVYLKLPRQSGHSSAAFELLSIYPTSHLIYPKTAMAQHAKQQIEQLYANEIDGARTSDGIAINLTKQIHTLNHSLHQTLSIFPEIELLIFDNYSHLTRVEIESKMLESVFAITSQKTKLYVFLQ